MTDLEVEEWPAREKERRKYLQLVVIYTSLLLLLAGVVIAVVKAENVASAVVARGT